jgi:hypothetical protein
MNTLPSRQRRKPRLNLPWRRKRSRNNLLDLNRIILSAPQEGVVVVAAVAGKAMDAAVAPVEEVAAGVTIMQEIEPSRKVPKSGDCID